MKNIIPICVLVIFFVSLNVSNSDTLTVDEEFHGIWVENSQKSCISDIRIEVYGGLVTLYNKNDSAKFGNLDICYSCAGGV